MIKWYVKLGIAWGVVALADKVLTAVALVKLDPSKKLKLGTLLTGEAMLGWGVKHVVFWPYGVYKRLAVPAAAAFKGEQEFSRKLSEYFKTLPIVMPMTLLSAKVPTLPSEASAGTSEVGQSRSA